MVVNPRGLSGLKVNINLRVHGDAPKAARDALVSLTKTSA